MPTTLAELMAAAEARIRRLEPAEAWAAAVAGEATIVDVRSTEDRAAGVVPGSVHVPRTVLEWRLAPHSEWRNPDLVGSPILLMCAHGFSSVLAAATLVDLGVDAADIRGGFEAWAAAGLPHSAPK